MRRRPRDCDKICRNAPSQLKLPPNNLRPQRCLPTSCPASARARVRLPPLALAACPPAARALTDAQTPPNTTNPCLRATHAGVPTTLLVAHTIPTARPTASTHALPASPVTPGESCRVVHHAVIRHLGHPQTFKVSGALWPVLSVRTASLDGSTESRGWRLSHTAILRISYVALLTTA